jgi:hypothetical protein
MNKREMAYKRPDLLTKEELKYYRPDLAQWLPLTPKQFLLLICALAAMTAFALFGCDARPQNHAPVSPSATPAAAQGKILSSDPYAAADELAASLGVQMVVVTDPETGQKIRCSREVAEQIQQAQADKRREQARQASESRQVVIVHNNSGPIIAGPDPLQEHLRHLQRMEEINEQQRLAPGSVLNPFYVEIYP